MLNRIRHRQEPEKPKTKKLWGRDFDIVDNGLDEEQVVSFVSELMKQHEASPAAPSESLSPYENLGKLDIAAGEENTAPVKPPGKRAALQPLEALMKEPSERSLARETPGTEEVPNRDNKTLYSGEVDLVIDVPVDMKMVSMLYDSLQTITSLRLLHMIGSTSQGVTISLAVNKPVPLIDIILSKLPGVEAAPGISEENVPGRDRFSLPFGKKKKVAIIIKMTSKRGVARRGVSSE